MSSAPASLSTGRSFDQIGAATASPTLPPGDCAMDCSLSSVDPAVIDRLQATGMLPSLHAQLQPDAIAVYSHRGNRTFSELNANANRLLDSLRRAGVCAGDHVSLLCPNVAEFVEVYAAILRGGLRLTPINWHLKPDEVAYIVENSDAKVLIAHSDFAASAIAAAQSPKLIVRLAVEGTIAGFDSYADALAAGDPRDPADPRHGLQMLYTSGTTGRQKGVYREQPVIRARQWGPRSKKKFRSGDISLALGPSYHAAPLGHSIGDPLLAGIPIVFVEKFDAEEVLAAIEKYHISHVHMVSTMFQRLLALPSNVRHRYDMSSLRLIVHGAAPTPPDVKRAMMEWVGPILDEYYGASEGSGGYYITAAEWLQKPGSVGRRIPEMGSRIVDDAGNDLAPGQTGRIFFRFDAAGAFHYYKDPAKTAEVSAGGSHFTVGDMGYVDDDGYLFLTGRTAECIISGGVNIYPQEVDNALLQHPAVQEACTIGAPNDEWGEEVKAVIVLHPSFDRSSELAKEIIAFVKPTLATFKVPRSVDFVDDIPRSEAGKVLRGQVRAMYWTDRQRKI